LNALRTLLEGRLDYAGLFPPAALGMEDAWRTFRRHHAGEEAWLTGAFVCPVSRLAELAPWPAPGDGPFALTLLTTPSAEGGTEASAWEAFRRQVAVPVEIRAWEIRLPADGVSRLEEPLAWGDALPGTAPRFWEADAAWSETQVEQLAQALAKPAGGAHPGLKLRCGGVTPAEVPAAERVALVLELAARHGLPLKLTAGLHHPLRHRRDGYGPMHGFLNVYLAALLARQGALSRASLVEVVEEEDPAAFTVAGDGLGWRGVWLDRLEVIALAAGLAGHGSCSVDEPVEDLKALGWWPGCDTSKER
jgi:hypothetical protein